MFLNVISVDKHFSAALCNCYGCLLINVIDGYFYGEENELFKW